MKPAQIAMQKVLKTEPSNNAQIKLIQNVTALPSTDKDEIKSNLVLQVTSTVRWRETMEFLSQNNVTDVIELGPSAVLTGMFKRAYKDIYATAPHTKEEIEELANNL